MPRDKLVERKRLSRQSRNQDKPIRRVGLCADLEESTRIGDKRSACENPASPGGAQNGLLTPTKRRRIHTYPSLQDQDTQDLSSQECQEHNHNVGSPAGAGTEEQADHQEAKSTLGTSPTGATTASPDPTPAASQSGGTPASDHLSLASTSTVHEVQNGSVHVDGVRFSARAQKNIEACIEREQAQRGDGDDHESGQTPPHGPSPRSILSPTASTFSQGSQGCTFAEEVKRVQIPDGKRRAEVISVEDFRAMFPQVVSEKDRVHSTLPPHLVPAYINAAKPILAKWLSTYEKWALPNQTEVSVEEMVETWKDVLTVTKATSATKPNNRQRDEGKPADGEHKDAEAQRSRAQQQRARIMKKFKSGDSASKLVKHAVADHVLMDSNDKEVQDDLTGKLFISLDEERCMPDPGIDVMVVVNPSHTRKALTKRTSKNGDLQDVFGTSFRRLSYLSRDKENFKALHAMNVAIINGRVPDRVAQLLALQAGMALWDQKKGKPRPIAWSSILVMWAYASLQIAHGKPLTLNYACGKDGGTQAAILHVNTALLEDPEHQTVGIGCDLKNAYGHCSRVEGLRDAYAAPTMGYLKGIIKVVYGAPPFSYVVHRPTSKNAVVIKYNDGFSMGCPLAGAIMCNRVQRYIPADDVTKSAVPYSDNIFWIYSSAWEALEQYPKWLESLPPDLVMVTEIILWPWRDEPAEELWSLLEACPPEDGTGGRQGWTRYLGAYVGNFYEDEEWGEQVRDDICSHKIPYIKEACEFLVHQDLPRQIACVLLRFLSYNFSHLMRTVPPGLLAKAAEQCDTLIVKAVLKVADVAPVFWRGKDIEDEKCVARRQRFANRVFLPWALGGMGFNSCVSKSRSAYLASVVQYGSKAWRS